MEFNPQRHQDKKNQQQLQEDEWQTQRMINNNQQVKFHANRTSQQ